MADDTTRISPEETEVDPTTPSGLPEGTIDKENDSVPEAVRERIEHREVVVHETDKDGNVTGWHKEAAPDGGDQ